MKPTFADTYYFIALLSPDDDGHARATEFARAFSGRMMTTAWVLTELADGLCRPPIRDRVGLFTERLIQEPGIEIVLGDESLFAAGLQLYRQRPDKDWSLTDCISFVVMQREGIREALTGDHHFEQPGFTALLK
ncbi:MAG: hypothetical protein KatS3mg105_0859 [Gemmatales bacterium]|nr:MAG: hypothetical protein KatS3mg105_0859 [Gemmatales bacterium]